jgi:mannose-6-phosphate isomerase
VSALPDLLPMRPYMREMVWGGRKLETLYGKDLPRGKAIGESFELSAYGGRESTVAAGPLAGRDLSSLVSEYGPELVGHSVHGLYGGRFPLLIKLLDAQQNLSVQVHPDDAYTRLHSLDHAGKMEAWYVLHSDGGRVAYGLQAGVDRQSFIQAIGGGEVEEAIRFHTVRPGDVLFMPPGTVHALCSGVVLYEVQQSSDVTFRIYDYGRVGLDGKARDLHVEQALEVIDFDTDTGDPTPWQGLPEAQSDRAVLVDCEHFQLNLYRGIEGPQRHAAGDSFLALTVVDGLARVSAPSGLGFAPDLSLAAGQTVLIPSRREFTVAPDDGAGCAYLVVSAGPAPVPLALPGG